MRLGDKVLSYQGEHGPRMEQQVARIVTALRVNRKNKMKGNQRSSHNKEQGCWFYSSHG